MSKRLLVLFTGLLVCAGMFPAFAETDVSQMSDAQIIATLKQDIVELDNKIKECEKQRKGWLATTIIGGVGVAATGTAAIVQGNQVSQDKKELNKINSQISK